MMNLERAIPNIKLTINTVSNLVWTFSWLCIALIHKPKSISYSSKYKALIFRTKTLYFLEFIPWYKNLRWIALGNIVVLNQREETWDELHELIHVEQFNRYFLIFPILNLLETMKNGYRRNRFEDEAFSQAWNNYYPN